MPAKPLKWPLRGSGPYVVDASGHTWLAICRHPEPEKFAEWVAESLNNTKHNEEVAMEQDDGYAR